MPDRRLQAKDLDSDRLVALIAQFQATKGMWANRWELAEALPDFPAKVVQAKLRTLVKSGRIRGCACGCRGDFEVPGLPMESWQQQLAKLEARYPFILRPTRTEGWLFETTPSQRRVQARLVPWVGPYLTVTIDLDALSPELLWPNRVVKAHSSDQGIFVGKSSRPVPWSSPSYRLDSGPTGPTFAARS